MSDEQSTTIRCRWCHARLKLSAYPALSAAIAELEPFDRVWLRCTHCRRVFTLPSISPSLVPLLSLLALYPARVAVTTAVKMFATLANDAHSANDVKGVSDDA